ncbi:hypothetical protein EDD17DRAFT_1762815 [Pisolithus thermaeus]|nr:hypothetical protein EV401DRAFT_2079636 [Pisolithus croceorrhizus]KAI6159087.1 hypothetical protein EDD17DRAFT_1762815 [Pisolithus thermaeus]
MGTSEAESFGPALIGGLVSAMLYGVTTLQSYVYYLNDSEDALTIKFLVAIVWILDTLHILFMSHALYYYLITGYGVPTSFEYIVWSLPVRIPNFLLHTEKFPSLGHGSGECNRDFCSPMLLCASNLSPFVNHEVSIVTQITFYAVTPVMTIMGLAEVVITMSLCILLYDRGSGSALPRTKRLLNTLIIYAVNRCLLILLAAAAILAVVLAAQDMWFLALSLVIGKLYANSLLASLNSREHLRSQGTGSPPDLCVCVVHFANLPKLPGDIESFKNKTGRVDAPEAAVIDVTIDPAPDSTMML